MLNRIVLGFIGILICGAANATTNVSLGDMFDDYQNNKYAFTQKYKDKELVFDAVVDSIESSCWLTLDPIPCAKLSDPHSKVEIWGMEVPMTAAVMKNNDDLLKLSRKQKVSLTCILKNPSFDLTTFTFNKCTINY